MSYYHQKFAFFPDTLNHDETKFFKVYLVSNTKEEVKQSSSVEGDPDSVPKAMYNISPPVDGTITKTRVDEPDIEYTGLIHQFIKK